MEKNKLQLLEPEITEGLNPQMVSELNVSFEPLFKQAQEWKIKAESIKVTDISQVDEMKAARDARLALKNIRVEAEKTRKKLKEDIVREGKAIDGIYNVIEFLVKPIEKHLEDQEKFVENKEKERLDKLEENRRDQLSQYCENIYIYNLRELSEEAYEALLRDQKKLWESREAEKKQAEEVRIAKEKADKEEQERTRLENEKLKREAEERETKLAEENKLRVEKEAEEKRLREEKAKKEREEYFERLKAERAAREKAEAELAEQKKVEEDARLAEVKRLKDLELAPDKEKLKSLISELLDLKYPEMQSEEGKKVIGEVKELISRVNEHIVKNIEKL